ncbi:MAG: NAD(P)H-hydrate dehydratase [Agathobacter sp.]|nr:NAD(P)H-hydrate dehydratase [Agathobacter sp.]
MQYLVTGKEMKLLDQNTSNHFHVPPVVLMEQAAGAFVQKLLSFDRQLKRVLVVCGYGNNGGDGIAIARLLNQKHILTYIYLCMDKEETEDNLYQMQKRTYRAYGYPEVAQIAAGDEYDCVIDAVFGTGLSRQIRGMQEQTIEGMNHLSGWKVAVDIASGVSADTGEIMGTAFEAEDTFTFSFQKIGQTIWPGREKSGRVSVLPIGITEESFLERKPSFATLCDGDLSLLPKRTAHSNKGTYGKLLVIAGNPGMAGAAFFAAKAAYRTGCGLVKIYTAEENRIPLQTLLPEAILSTYDKKYEEKQLSDELKWADAVVMGPGIGNAASTFSMLKFVLQSITVPLLLDADALNLLAREPELLLRPHLDLILTPHLGEMARLNNETVSLIQTRLIETAQEFAMRYDVVCVLKDANTITAVPYGMTYINTSGNHGMATAGSGDVLSGVIGALLAQGASAENASTVGVHLHGRAGDFACSNLGARTMTASDILDGLSGILCNVE